MFTSQNILWITFAAFCVTTTSCKDVYQKRGDSVLLDCGTQSQSGLLEWKLNGVFVLNREKSGRMRKGNLETVSRATLNGNSLKITDLKDTDSGEYSCSGHKHTVYVASAYASPSTVLHSSHTTLSCDITKNSEKTFQWISPKSETSVKNKVTVNSVTSEHDGAWTCQIKDKNKQLLIELKVVISVIGPLMTKEKVNSTEGNDAVLPCFLMSSSLKGLTLTGGSWTRKDSPDVPLITLMRQGSSVQWNKTKSAKVVPSSDKELQTVFNVTLKTVKPDDAGVYVCRLEFDNGNSLEAALTLEVTKKDSSAPGPFHKDSKVLQMLQKPIFGVQAWIWILACLIVLIIFVVIIVLIRRNRRMKREIRRSMRRPKHYCNCDRTRKQPGKSPGKRERPPPLPRHQYNSLNE